jgi:hypothetical protein
MATIKTDFGSGGANLTPNDSAGSPSLATTVRDIADDLVELRTKLIALLTKLDLDFTGENAAVLASELDVNYVATCSPAALKTIKG